MPKLKRVTKRPKRSKAERIDAIYDWLDQYWVGRDRGGERAMRSFRMSAKKTDKI